MKSIALLVVATLAATATNTEAQCRPPANSHEARLLAFYEAPLVFSMAGAPTQVAPGEVRVAAEAGNVPSPNPALQRPEFCYEPHSENTKLTPAFGRPRITLGLPAGFALEASYLPPVTIGSATPNLASVAVARPISFLVGGSEVTLALRAHGTFGRVRGSITCPRSALQTTDPTAVCYGTQPSRDTFYPTMFGSEGALGLRAPDGRVAIYAGGGITWLRPRFRVGFTDATNYDDETEVDARLVRGSAFGGVSLNVSEALQLSGQLYSVPKDVTTARATVAYRLRH
jgi:hypothetical protein